MLDHDPTHKMRMIPSGRWEDFLTDLARNQQGRTIRIEQDEATRQVILETLEYHHPLMGGHDVEIIAKEAGADQSITVDFNLVWAVFDEDDKMVAVQLADDQNRKTILHLR
jgi:hypothetical protein